MTSLKRFLRPSTAKIIITFILFALFSYLWRVYIISSISDTFPLGFPLQFYLAWGPCQQGEICSETKFLYLILDIVFWYIVSAFLILISARNFQQS
jgi:hypothetical protein